jgi:hypothetical protein
MSLFSDLFTSGYQKAADVASGGYTAGYNQAVPQYQAGMGALTSNYGAALQSLQPATAGANAGANAYAGALGIGGDPAQIQKHLEATPGYQFTLGQGLQAIDRGAASRGLTTSGNTLAAEQKYGAGLANQTYQNYVQNLQPYLAQQTQTGALNANVNTGLGNQLNAAYGNLGNLGYNTQAAIGNTQAAADIAGQNAQNSFIGGVLNLGSKLLGSTSGSSTNSFGTGGGGGYDPSQFTKSGLYLGGA